MAHDLSTYPDTAALLHQALRKSWRRDRFKRTWVLAWRWFSWAASRYGSWLVAAAMVSASTPALLDSAGNTQPATDSLKLIPSYQLTPINNNP